MKVDLFPTSVYRYHVEEPEALKQRVIEFYNENKFKDENLTPQDWNCQLFTTFGSGYFPISEAIEAFSPHFDEFQEETKNYGNVILTDLWLNCYESTNWQEKHTHSPGQWSAVYYAVFDPNEHRGTKFLDPNEHVRAANGFKENAAEPWVQEGDLIIFPSYLEHSAPLNKSSKLRSTISFNFFVEQEIYEGGDTDFEKLVVGPGVST
jgi:uncharacterized protein (TIGR02466 family)